ncbi:MAG: dihydroorotate dehydrogenase [Planctomycetota bacterium]
MPDRDAPNTDLSVDLCGLELRNPTVMASGILGTSLDLLHRAADCGAGAATIKSISEEERKGHNNPTVIATGSAMLNAVGYSNPGVEAAVEEFGAVDEVDIPVLGSVIGQEAADFARVAERLMECGFDGLEVPLSCPHTPGYGTLAGHGTPEATEEITRAVREVTNRPLFVKISPNVQALGEVALAAVEGGADGITAVNTLGPGMVIDVDSGEPVLDFDAGGLSGPALRPVAVRCVHDVYAALRREGRDAAIIGTGGVSTGEHALQMIMAGATAVGMGTAVYQRGTGAFGRVAEELSEECRRLDIGSLDEVRGCAHG